MYKTRADSLPHREIFLGVSIIFPTITGPCLLLPLIYRDRVSVALQHHRQPELLLRLLQTRFSFRLYFLSYTASATLAYPRYIASFQKDSKRTDTLCYDLISKAYAPGTTKDLFDCSNCAPIPNTNCRRVAIRDHHCPSHPRSVSPSATPIPRIPKGPKSDRDAHIPLSHTIRQA